MIKLLTDNVKDQVTREVIETLINLINREQPLKGQWKFFELTFNQNGTFKVPHGLMFAPKDVVQLSIRGAIDLTWQFAKFDKTNVELTTTGACTVRALIGTYSEA